MFAFAQRKLSNLFKYFNPRPVVFCSSVANGQAVEAESKYVLLGAQCRALCRPAARAFRVAHFPDTEKPNGAEARRGACAQRADCSFCSSLPLESRSFGVLLSSLALLLRAVSKLCTSQAASGLFRPLSQARRAENFAISQIFHQDSAAKISQEDRAWAKKRVAIILASRVRDKKQIELKPRR